MKFSLILSIFSTILATTKAIEPVTIEDNAFYLDDERFYIRGVDYQPGGSSNLTDPLSDTVRCTRDVKRFTELGLNTIRVYSVDNTVDHSDCMNMLEEAGIYVIVDVNTPETSISRYDASCSYNLDYLTEIFATIDEFQQYNNTLGFFAANELVNTEKNFKFSPYIKAVTRDMKQYMRAQNYRAIPVGYSSADVAEIRYDLAHYLNCGDDNDTRIDMLGVNDYSWCGESSFTVSGYNTKVEKYSGYSIPLFLSEYGCNEVVSSRPFTEVEAIYSTKMSSVFSGGLVYEYFNYTNDYGLVEIINSTAVKPLQDFYNLGDMLNSTSDPTGDGGAASYNYSSCPTGLNFSTTVPDQPDGIETLLEDGPQGNNLGFEADTQSSCSDDEDDDISSYSSSSSFSSSSSLSSSKTSKTSSSAASSTLFTSTVASSSASVSSISSTSSNNAGLTQSSSFMSILALAAGIFYF